MDTNIKGFLCLAYIFMWVSLLSNANIVYETSALLCTSLLWKALQTQNISNEIFFNIYSTTQQKCCILIFCAVVCLLLFHITLQPYLEACTIETHFRILTGRDITAARKKHHRHLDRRLIDAQVCVFYLQRFPCDAA